MASTKIFIALPTYNGQIHYKILDGLFGTIIATPLAKGITVQKEKGSLLCAVFNKLWCRALNARNAGWTHFAMMHADVEAPPN